MKRLTTDDTESILQGLNLFFAKDGEVWIRGGGPEPDYPDCTLVDYIGRVAETHHLDIFSRDAEHLGDEMYDCLQYGTEELEGVVALLHAAAVQAAEMRGRLADIENILGDDYDMDRLRELAEADRDGRCVVLPCKVGDTVWFNSYSCNAEVCHGIQPHEIKATRVYVIVEGEHTDVGLSIEQVDKTWFLEKSVAKAALKGEQHEISES